MIRQKLPPFQNVAASSIATMPMIPLGMTYHSIVFKLGGTSFLKSHINYIRFRLGGKQFMDISGSHLDAQNLYIKEEADAAYLVVYFGDPRALTIAGRNIAAIDTSVYAGGTPFECEVSIGGATAPTLEAWANLLPPKADTDPNKQTIRALLKSVHTPGSAGEHALNIPIGSQGGALLRRIYAHHGGNVTKMQVLKDGLFLLQEGEIALMSFMQDTFYRDEQANLEVIDFIEDDIQSGAIATLRANAQLASFQFKYTTSASDTITTYTDLTTRLALL